MTLRVMLGRAVRRLRSGAGFSQESFADACHLHRTYIGSIERGETNVSLDNIERVAQTLKVPVSKLFSEAEQER
jgi:transcriptional regulator with XRE-family HTH domain